MKIVFISNLFPDTVEPYRGLDNSCLLQHLSRHCEIRVLSPRPTLPRLLAHRVQPRVPCPADVRFEPQYLGANYIPKLGSLFNHLLFERAIRQPLNNLRRRFKFDLVLCSWMYPDGCAVARLAVSLQVPSILVAQGSDVHRYLRMAFRRKRICRAANQSAGVITRSRKLAELLTGAGVANEKLHPICNGVDLDTFRPGDRKSARLSLGLPLEVPLILFVGNFYEVKNPLLLVSAHAELCRRQPVNRLHLVMIGDGPLRQTARREADAGGAGGQVVLAGQMPPAQVARYMQAADLLCVPSDDEGVPNVILEAFACGLPTVATRVGGIPEVLCHDFLGRLVEPSDQSAIVRALAERLAGEADCRRIRQHVVQFSWANAAQAYYRVLLAALSIDINGPQV